MRVTHSIGVGGKSVWQCVCMLLWSVAAISQQYHFRTINTADGLGSSSVNHVFQDSKGYVWLATQMGGVSRFNGQTLTTFTTAHGLIHNDVTFIAEDTAHHIWITTAAGASRYDGKRMTRYGQQQGLTDGLIFSVYADKQNRLWFA